MLCQRFTEYDNKLHSCPLRITFVIWANTEVALSSEESFKNNLRFKEDKAERKTNTVNFQNKGPDADETQYFWSNPGMILKQKTNPRHTSEVLPLPPICDFNLPLMPGERRHSYSNFYFHICIFFFFNSTTVVLNDFKYRKMFIYFIMHPLSSSSARNKLLEARCKSVHKTVLNWGWGLISGVNPWRQCCCFCRRLS